MTSDGGPFSIALLPGDGVGPEVIAAATEVLTAVERRFRTTYDRATWPIGGAALRQGARALPASTLEACLRADAVLLGAVGDPAFDSLPRPDRVETGLLQLRQAMGVYANLRPARAWTALDGIVPFKPQRIAGADLLIVRELLGGLYFGEPRSLSVDGDRAINTLTYTAQEVERVARVGFALARARRKRLTSVDKANVLETSQLWRAVVTRVGHEFPDVTLEHQYVDSCAMLFALDPKRFDVVLTENLFGDILSDEAGALAGSLGMLPSASLGAGPGLFEPVHGSAPAIAGRDAANPIGAIGSLAMLLRHAAGAEDQAAVVEEAVEGALADGCRTADIAEPGAAVMPCSAMGRAIADRVATG